MLPKKRQSKTRSKKRRTHYKSSLVHTVTCKNTGEEHLPHHAYYHDGILYYKGKPLRPKLMNGCFIFSGQGSHRPGMGLNLHKYSISAKNKFDYQMKSLDMIYLK